MGIIYITTNIVNGKQYVGQTSRDFKQRKKEHTRPGDCKYFYRALKKYGIDNFKWVSFSCPEEELDWQETFLIAELKTQKPNGYNLDSGGHKHKKASEETRRKNSINHLGEKNSQYGLIGELSPNFGRKHKEESIILMKKKKTEYYENPKNKLFGENNSNFGNRGENNPIFGIPKSIAHKIKLSETHKGKNNGMYGKTFYGIWIEKYGQEVADEKWKNWMKTRKRNN